MSWLGGTDSALEGTFSWSDGTAWSFDNWKRGEPNAERSHNAHGGEDCVTIDGRNHSTNGQWNDLVCRKSWVRAYVCKKVVTGTSSDLFLFYLIS